MAEILSLVDRQAAPNNSVVEQLEKLLIQAKSGEIINLAWATVTKTDDNRSGFAEGPRAIALLGSVAFLHHHLAAVLFDRATDG